MSDFNSHLHRLTSPALGRAHKAWFITAFACRGHAEGRERAALRYAKVIRDGICQMCKWLPFTLLPCVFYQQEELTTESLLNSDSVYIQMISVRWATFVFQPSSIKSHIFGPVDSNSKNKRGDNLSEGTAPLFGGTIPICLILTRLFFFFNLPPSNHIYIGKWNPICRKAADNPGEWKMQFNNLLLQTHLETQRAFEEGNNGWALAASWLLLDHFLSDR